MQPTIQDSGLSESGGVLYLRRSGHEQWPWEEMRRWRWWNPRFTRMHHILLDRSWHSIDSTCMIMHAIHALLYSCAKTDQCAKQGSEWRHIHDVTNIWAAERTLNTWHAKPFRIFSTLKALQDMACTCLHFQLQWSFHTKMMGQNPQQPASVCGISMSKCWPTWQFWWLNWPFVLVDITFFPTSLCGVLVFGCVLPCVPPPPPPPASFRPPTHIQQLTHNLLTHNLLTHNSPTHNLLTHNSPTHNLLTHNSLTHTHNLLKHTHTTLQHTTYPHAQLTHVHSAWQAWHLWHWAGSGCVLGSRLAPLSPRLFVWQAWHLATSTFTLHGRRCTWWHKVSLCVAWVALGDIDVARWNQMLCN